LEKGGIGFKFAKMKGINLPQKDIIIEGVGKKFKSFPEPAGQF
jgi:hypothetical protein